MVVQSLAHLGIGRLVLVDPDRIEVSNLNRVVGATPADAQAGTLKVSIARRLATQINPAAQVVALPTSVLDPHTWWRLRAVDVLIGAVDSNAARWAINLLAVQYARLYLDVAVEITRHQNTLEVAGHLAVVRPDGPCLRCLHGYDPAQAAQELQPQLMAAKRAAGYLADQPDEPAPSVIFLNQALAAQAVAEVLNWVTGWRSPQTYLLVDLTSPAVTPIAADPDPACSTCGPSGLRGLGDLGGMPLKSGPPASPPPHSPPTRSPPRPTAR